MNSTLTEIASYLKSEDIQLARRRILDAAFDSRDPSIIRKTIEWSKSIKTFNFPYPADLLAKGAAILEEVDTKTNRENDPKGNLLQARGIAKQYRKGNFKLNPIDVEVKYGDVWGIVGENGNGKTTLLRCLSGQLKIDAGSIQYYFLKDTDPGYYLIKQQVAFIPQRIPKWFGQLKDNLHFSATIMGLFDEANDLMVDFMLERLDLTEYANLTWDQISSGYRTRFEIARILIQRPKLLILDEPLANLDINAQQILLQDLRNICKSSSHPMGIILSSQQLHEVEKVADNVIFIKKGSYIFSTLQAETEKSNSTVEIESVHSKTDLENILKSKDPEVSIKFNGGVYVVESKTLSPEQILIELVGSKIKLSYYRDITHSTKKYFN
jgi:ABC-2 type transport system ATP-binding protein